MKENKVSLKIFRNVRNEQFRCMKVKRKQNEKLTEKKETNTQSLQLHKKQFHIKKKGRVKGIELPRTRFNV